MALAIELTADPSSDVLTAAAWRDDRFDFWAFDRQLDELDTDFPRRGRPGDRSAVAVAMRP